MFQDLFGSNSYFWILFQLLIKAIVFFSKLTRSISFVIYKNTILCFVEYVCQHMFVCLCLFGGLCFITLTYFFPSRLEFAVHAQQLYRKIIKYTSDGELGFDSQINTSAFHQCSLVIRTLITYEWRWVRVWYTN